MLLPAAQSQNNRVISGRYRAIAEGQLQDLGFC
jgi:hypothetical protein